MNFSLEKEELIKLNAWLAEQDAKVIAKQKESMSAEDFSHLTMDGKFPYTGAIGGGITYSFSPTSLGLVTKVTYDQTGETLDLTDYDSW